MPVNWEMRMNNLKIMEGDWLQRMTANIPVEMTSNIPAVEYIAPDVRDEISSGEWGQRLTMNDFGEWTVEFVAPDAWNNYMQTIRGLEEAKCSFEQMSRRLAEVANAVSIKACKDNTNVEELKIKFDDVIP